MDRAKLKEKLATLYHYWLANRLSDEEYEKKCSVLIKKYQGGQSA